MSLYLSLPNLSATDVRIEEPAEWPPELEGSLSFPTKEDFRTWSVQSTTDHIFYSLTEGVSTRIRVNVHDNPAHILHGFVADYDGSGIVIPDLIARCRSLPERIRPTWVTETYSHKARVIWEFLEPVQLTGDRKHDDKFLRLLGKELRVEKLAPGLDDASYDTKMYWEFGRAWHSIGGKIARDVTFANWLSVIEKMKFEGSDHGDTTIPIEVVAAQLEKRYPSFRSRWVGDFVPGSRGPLFWIDDGIDRVGCVVTDVGVRAFSTRASKGLMTWSDLLGSEFVKEFQQKRLSDAAGETYYETGSSTYCIRVADEWRRYSKEDLLMRLKVAGISHRLKQGKTATDAEQVLTMVQETRRVDGQGPFLFNENPVVNFNGFKMLNTAASNSVMKPAADGDPAKWPWLSEFFENIFEDVPQNDCHPREFFFAWLQRFWRSGLNCEPRLGQLGVLAGKPSRGKSFLGVAVLRRIMGGAVDASNYLLEGKGFNRELGASPIWNVDDAKSTATFNDHKRFSEMLKKHAASPELVFHPKYMDAVTLPWYGRIFITCNDDSDSLSILPTLDGSILDKLHLFRCHATWKANFGTLKENDEMLSRELPHFLAWLDAWTPPDGVIDAKNPRYGVVSYHHPALVESARDSSPDHRFVEILEAWRESLVDMHTKGKPTIWLGSCTDLIRAVNSDQSLAPLMRNYSPVAVGRILTKISEYYKPLIRTTKTCGITRYTIDYSLTP
jgi:hypothetical protein